MLDKLRQIVRCLEHGEIPAEKEIQDICGKITVIFVAFALYADESGEEIALHILEHSDNQGVVLRSIHAVWTALCMQQMIAQKDAVIGKFEGVAIYSLTETLDIYAAHKRLLSHPCSWCKQTYGSDLNRSRCEATHTSRRHLGAFEVLPLGGMTGYWDAMDRAARTAIVRPAAAYLPGIPEGATFSPAVTKIIEAVDDPAVCGRELMVGLDEASEYTFAYKLMRPMDAPALYTRGDYVSAIAHTVITNLDKAYTAHLAKKADDMAELLLQEHPAKPPCKKKTPKTNPKKPSAKKKPKTLPTEEAVPEKKLAEDPLPPATPLCQDLLQKHIERQLEEEEEYAYEAHLRRVDHLIFGSHALPLSVRNWADAP
jgi:hypothetical protein